MISTAIRRLSPNQERERLLRPWGWTTRSGPDPSSLIGRQVSWTDEARRARSGVVFGSPERVNREINLVPVCCDASTRIELVCLRALEVQPFRPLQGPAAPPPGALRSLEGSPAPAAPAEAPGTPPRGGSASSDLGPAPARKWKAKSPEAQARFNEQRRFKRAAAKAAKEAAKEAVKGAGA